MASKIDVLKLQLRIAKLEKALREERNRADLYRDMYRAAIGKATAPVDDTDVEAGDVW